MFEIEENGFPNLTKEMHSIVGMGDVKEFIRLAQNQEGKHDQIANDLEHAATSGYLDATTKCAMLKASNKERHLASKWNALWAVFSQAEFHEVKY